MSGFDKIVADYSPCKARNADKYGKEAYSYSPCGFHNNTTNDTCDLTRESISDHPDYQGFGLNMAQGAPGSIAGSDFGIGDRRDVIRGKSISSNTDSSLGIEFQQRYMYAPCGDKDESIPL